MNLYVGLALMGVLLMAMLVVFFYSKKLEKKRKEEPNLGEEKTAPGFKKPKQEGKASNLLGFKTIEQGIITLPNHQGICAIIGVDALPYPSLSEEEQESVDGAQASMLASLNFPIQPVSITKPVDLNNYIQQLQNPSSGDIPEALQQYAAQHIRYLEEETKQEILVKEDFLVIRVRNVEEEGKVKNELDRRCGLIISALRRAGHLARVLDTPEVADIFYDIFHANRVMNARLQDAIENETNAFSVHGDPPPIQSTNLVDQISDTAENDGKRFVMLR